MSKPLDSGKTFFDMHVCPLILTRGEFNKASASERSLFWYLSLFVMCKAWHQYNERSRALALLNSPLVDIRFDADNPAKMKATCPPLVTFGQKSG